MSLSAEIEGLDQEEESLINYDLDQLDDRLPVHSITRLSISKKMGRYTCHLRTVSDGVIFVVKCAAPSVEGLRKQIKIELKALLKEWYRRRELPAEDNPTVILLESVVPQKIENHDGPGFAV